MGEKEEFFSSYKRRGGTSYNILLRKGGKTFSSNLRAATYLHQYKKEGEGARKFTTFIHMKEKEEGSGGEPDFLLSRLRGEKADSREREEFTDNLLVRKEGKTKKARCYITYLFEGGKGEGSVREKGKGGRSATPRGKGEGLFAVFPLGDWLKKGGGGDPISLFSSRVISTTR